MLITPEKNPIVYLFEKKNWFVGGSRRFGYYIEGVSDYDFFVSFDKPYEERMSNYDMWLIGRLLEIGFTNNFSSKYELHDVDNAFVHFVLGKTDVIFLDPSDWSRLSTEHDLVEAYLQDNPSIVKYIKTHRSMTLDHTKKGEGKYVYRSILEQMRAEGITT